MYKTKYLYVYSNDENDWRNEPLYIGQQARYSDSFPRHFEHLAETDPQYQEFRSIKYIYITLLPNCLDLNLFERLLIEEYSPLLNTIFNPEAGYELDDEHSLVLDEVKDNIDNLKWVRFNCDDFNPNQVFSKVYDFLNQYDQQEKISFKFANINEYLDYICTDTDSLKNDECYLKDQDVFISFDGKQFKNVSNITSSKILTNEIQKIYKTCYTLTLDDMFNFKSLTEGKNLKYNNSDFVEFYDERKILSKEKFEEFGNEYCEDYIEKLRNHAKAILYDLARVANFRIAKSGIEEMLSVLNSESIGNHNFISAVCRGGVMISDEKSLFVAKASDKYAYVSYYSPLDEDIMVTDNFIFTDKEWKFVKSEFLYSPDEEDVLIPVYGIPEEKLKVHFKYDDNSYSLSFPDETIERIPVLLKDYILPVCNKVIDLEPEFCRNGRMIDLAIDKETGEIITEDEPYSVSKIGNGYNIKNHKLIYEEFSVMLWYTHDKDLDFYYCSKFRPENRRIEKKRLARSLRGIGYIDFLETPGCVALQAIADDIKTLSITDFYNKYSA